MNATFRLLVTMEPPAITSPERLTAPVLTGGKETTALKVGTHLKLYFELYMGALYQ